MKNIIIFGAPGSGKGTYSDEIVERYGMGHISTGDVLRAEIKNGTELGKIAQGYISRLRPTTLNLQAKASSSTVSLAQSLRQRLSRRCFKSADTNLAS